MAVFEVSPDSFALYQVLERPYRDPERKIIKLLLEHGADPNRPRWIEEREWEAVASCPLYFVTDPDIVELLVEKISAFHQQIWCLYRG